MIFIMSMFDRNILYNLSQAQHFLEDRVRPASTQISMHTRTDFSVFAVRRKALWIFWLPKDFPARTVQTARKCRLI